MKERPDDTNWREEYKNYTSSEFHLELLENGPRSLSQSWILSALYQKWLRMKGWREPEPPNCQSSFLEFENHLKSNG